MSENIHRCPAHAKMSREKIVNDIYFFLPEHAKVSLPRFLITSKLDICLQYESPYMLHYFSIQKVLF